jgi:hypothetical protein
MIGTKKPRGRPRTRPAGSKKRSLYLTDDEFAAAQEYGERAGVAAEQWMRTQILAAIRCGIPRRK